MALMASLYREVPGGLKPIAECLMEHLQNEGKQVGSLVRSKDQRKCKLDETIVASWVQMHDKYLSLLGECFLDHTVFHKALKNAFEGFINEQLPNKLSSSELISDFIDRSIRKGSDRKAPPSGAVPRTPRGEQALVDRLERVLGVLGYVHDKDVFSEFYRKQLAKRLLLGRSASAETEKALVVLLHRKCGAPMISKLAGMLKDQTLSKEVQQSFIAHMSEKNIKLNFTAEIQVLTAGFWPSYKEEKINVPEEIAHAISSFENYYCKERTMNRNLRWIHALGSMTLSGNFKTKKIDLVVNSYQGAVLLLFNTFPTLTMANICESLGMSLDQLHKHIMPLASGKYKVLRKVPDTTESKPSDCYTVNSRNISQ